MRDFKLFSISMQSMQLRVPLDASANKGRYMQNLILLNLKGRDIFQYNVTGKKKMIKEAKQYTGSA